MKKSIIFILVLLFVSCESDSINHEQGERVSPEIQSALSILKKRGFDTNKYRIVELPYGTDQKPERMISIEEDYLFLLKDLGGSSRDKQYSTNNLLKPSVAGNLRIALKTSGSSGISAQWQTAFQDAVSNWNSIKSSFSYIYTTYLRLVLVSEADPHDILVFKTNLGNPNVIAQAGFPTNTGNAFNSIYVNSGLVGSLTSSERLFTAIHEMGHSIGFRHTNWFDRNSDGVSDTSDPYDYEGISIYGANHIPGTAIGLDANSVMNAIVAPWSGFSTFDRIAVRYLYPKINFYKEFLEYKFYIYRGCPFFKLKIPLGLDPMPWKRYAWFYRVFDKEGSKWRAMPKQFRDKAEFRFKEGFRGTVQFAAIVDDKVSFLSEKINVKHK